MSNRCIILYIQKLLVHIFQIEWFSRCGNTLNMTGTQSNIDASSQHHECLISAIIVMSLKKLFLKTLSLYPACNYRKFLVYM